MNNKNIKVVDEHNIDRNASVMFGVDLNGSEYVVYWIERDENSNNVFVSKVLKNLDGTYNMLNIDDDDKKREVSEIVKYLISSSVSDQNDKLTGFTKTLANGEVAKFITVSFNKEQNINVPKTYITTVKKEVTKVVEDYYDVVSNENQIENVLTPVTNMEPTVVPVVESEPKIEETITNVVPEVSEVPVSVVEVSPIVQTTSVTPEPVVVAPVIPQPVSVETPSATTLAATPTEVSVDNITVPTNEVKPEVVIISNTPAVDLPKVEPEPVNLEVTPVLTSTTLVEPSVIVTPTPEVSLSVAEVAPVLQTTSVTPEPVAVAPVMPQPVSVETPLATMPTEVSVDNVTVPTNEVKPEVVVPVPTPVVTEDIMNTNNVTNDQPLVFNAVKETNLNAALGEVANSNTIPVENINVVREFGEETPVVQTFTQPVIAPMVQPNNATEPKMLVKKAGFANSKFFMVVAIAFFMASCVFLGYEVYNYFQITK